jgi:hypothetical protein
MEHRLWHLTTDQCFDQRPVRNHATCEEIRYLLFTLAQFLGFIEVVRREGPRERPFLQAGSAQGSDALSTMVEGVRFLLCASPKYLEEWWSEGDGRTHPGCRRRKTGAEVVEERGTRTVECRVDPNAGLLRISRGAQRAIGTYMITTTMGAERHYTMSYGSFHAAMEGDPDFRRWLEGLEADIGELASGEPWAGEGPFPFGCVKLCQSNKNLALFCRR